MSYRSDLPMEEFLNQFESMERLDGETFSYEDAEKRLELSEKMSVWDKDHRLRMGSYPQQEFYTGDQNLMNNRDYRLAYIVQKLEESTDE